MRKSASCLLLLNKINQSFDALVTGTGEKGTWVRVLQPPVEGKLVKGVENIDVGDKIRVKLVHVDVEKGFIDFIRIHG
jgi:exoribonuclease II